MWPHLHRLCEGFDAVALHPKQRLRPRPELAGHLDFWCASSSNEERLLHQTPDYALGVVQAALSLVKDLKRAER
jgi:hypothetical protein